MALVLKDDLGVANPVSNAFVNRFQSKIKQKGVNCGQLLRKRGRTCLYSQDPAKHGLALTDVRMLLSLYFASFGARLSSIATYLLDTYK